MPALTFHGAAGTVTGAKFLVEAGRGRVLLECGLFQGRPPLTERNWGVPPVTPSTLDAVLLSHAHLDHSGYLPRLARDGFAGPVYCSPGTAELVRIMLPDAARLQEEEAEFRNRHGRTQHHPALPLFTAADADRALGLLRVVDFGRAFEPAPGFVARLLRWLAGFQRPPSATWAVHGEPEAAAALRDAVIRTLGWKGCAVAADGARVDV